MPVALRASERKRGASLRSKAEREMRSLAGAQDAVIHLATAQQQISGWGGGEEEDGRR